MKEESVESWGTDRPAGEATLLQPSSTQQQEHRPSTVPQPRNTLTSFLHISSPSVPGPDGTQEPSNPASWQDRAAHSELHFSKLHVCSEDSIVELVEAHYCSANEVGKGFDVCSCCDVLVAVCPQRKPCCHVERCTCY